MKLYVGLVVGLEETSLCIVDSEGVTVREVKVSTEPEAIRALLRAPRIASIASVSKRRRWASGCTANYSRWGPDHRCRSPPYACFAVDDAQQD